MRLTPQGMATCSDKQTDGAAYFCLAHLTPTLRIDKFRSACWLISSVSARGFGKITDQTITQTAPCKGVDRLAVPCGVDCSPLIDCWTSLVHLQGAASPP